MARRKSPLEARRADVARLLKAGKNYYEILDELSGTYPDLSLSKIGHDVKTMLIRWRVAQQDHMGEYVQLELERLNSLINAIWNAATLGDLYAIDRFIKLQDQRLKLLGHDKPKDNNGILPNKIVLEWRSMDSTEYEDVGLEAEDEGGAHDGLESDVQAPTT